MRTQRQRTRPEGISRAVRGSLCKLAGVGVMVIGTAVLLMAEGVPTRVMVRAVSRDAKIISTAVGGARIVIRESVTGRILAQGLQQGSSGDTQRIMIEPRQRGHTVFDTPGAAGFLATVSLERPTRVEISAEGPLGFPQASQRATKTVLLLPGEDILGEGILLEIHGFIVTLIDPKPDWRPAAGQPLPVRATVRMA
ncbi:MAG: hypothetical protein ACE5JX_06345 [Acidobacteriota bacterium]